MELIHALRTTGAVRAFTDEPVDDATLARVLDTARFAPSGGNRQGWKLIVVQDPMIRKGIRDLYQPGWHEYLAMRGAGLTPWAPVTDRDAEAEAQAKAPEVAAAIERNPPGFAELIDQVPVLLVLLADLRALAAVDRDLDRYTLVGGASIYPFAWSILLAAREEGLGGVITTMVVRREPEAKALLHVPDHVAIAGVIAIGHPVKEFTRLTRQPVESFTTLDTADGRPFPS